MLKLPEGKKILFFQYNLMIFHDSGKQKSIKNRFKIDEKMLSKMEGLNFPSFC